MASPETESKLPYLPPEIWSKIFAEVSNHSDYTEFVRLWTQHRRVSSAFKSEIERTLIHQYLKKPIINVQLMPMLSALGAQRVECTDTSAEKKMGIDDCEDIEEAHRSEILVILKFHQLSPNENEITFKYQDPCTRPVDWSKLEHLNGTVMLRPLKLLMNTTIQNLPAQVEWLIHSEGRLSLSLTFDWKQFFSMFIVRDAQTYNQYFVDRRLTFACLCRGRLKDGTLEMCRGHGPRVAHEGRMGMEHEFG